MASIITVAALKGGTSKTTTAMALAAGAVDLGSTVAVVDLDPQGSALHWAALSQAQGYPPPFPVIAMTLAEVPWRASAIDAEIVIIDTPPVMVDVVRAGIRVASRVAIPLQPRVGDVARLPATAAMAQEAGIPAMAVLTMVRPGTTSPEETREAVADMGVPLARTTLPIRESVARSYGYGMAKELLFFGKSLLVELAERRS